MAKEKTREQSQKALDEYARSVIEAALPALPAEARAGAWEGLPRRAPEELDALACSQGAPLNADFDDLTGEFWPEDESCDEFIATVRQWRREGTNDYRAPQL
jgi:hypothetical protein